jgi:hypothetical protein
MKGKYNNNDEMITDAFIELNDGSDSKIISKKLIEEVVFDGQYAFAAHTIKKGMFEDITIKYLGKFKARHKQIQKMYSKLTIKKKR